ncbi:unnamed protein product [Mytilus coruscus]|uniref:Uncharacterized protein n=1 Tax=Mytilus coruscus TaxID=42192 RepID=A0A6J8EPQ0_MYTCO|nr:unnamed protein product [Mytilus coruscus]
MTLIDNFTLKSLMINNTDGITWVQFKDKCCNANMFYVCVVYLPPENSTGAVNVHEFMETLMTHIYTIPQVIDQVSKNIDISQTVLKLKYDAKSIPEDWLRGESVVTEINRKELINSQENPKEFWRKIGRIGGGSERQNIIPMEIKLNDGSICDDKNMVINKWKCDFEEMLNKNSDNRNEIENCNNDIICDEILDSEITLAKCIMW